MDQSRPPQVSRSPQAKREEEWTGPAWKHPYALYLIGTIILFAFLGLMAYLALENDWIPKR